VVRRGTVRRLSKSWPDSRRTAFLGRVLINAQITAD